MRRLSSWLCAIGVGTFAAGCGGGAFRQAVTSDDCKAGDERCSRAGFDAPLALGATALPKIRVTLNGSASPGLHFESAAPSVLEVEGGRVVGKREGTSALLFVSDANTVLDFLHVWVKKPTTLELDAALPGRDVSGRVDGAIDLLVGEELRLTAKPLADGQQLLGTGAAEWTVDPPIATLLREGSDDHRRIVAQTPGSATLHVTMLGVESSMQIVIHPRTHGVTLRPTVKTERGAS